MERIIFHIDVNSAYLSWTAIEELKAGETLDLRTIPSIIGGDQKSRRGVVLAKSIPAKKYGVKTGEPVAHALQKCPFLVMRPPSHDLYHQHSKNMMDYLRGLTPDIEKVSIDECFIDYTGISHLYPSYLEAASQIKETILERFGFTVNVGISSNKLLAKMASDFRKPNLVHTLFPDEIAAKMWPLPVSDLYMAGKSSVDTLNKLDIYTIGDLANSDPDLLYAHLKSHGRTLYEYANGIENTPVVSHHVEEKSIGNSTTLAKDVENAEDAYPVLQRLAETVSARLKEARLLAGSVCVEIKYNTFTSTSHQMQLDTPGDTTELIYKHARLLFDQLWNGVPLRLLGIRTGKLVPDDTPIQLSLFDIDISQTEKQRKLDQALEDIRKKFGDDAVTKGSFL